MAVRNRGSGTLTQTLVSPDSKKKDARDKPRSSKKRRTVNCLLIALLIILSLYIGGGVVLRLCPWAQQFIIFMHHLRTPFLANYSNPAEFGLKNTWQFELVHSEEMDSCRVLGWHVLPKSYLDRELEPIAGEDYQRYLSDGTPIILYLHGNTGTRATPHRVQTYRFLAEERGYHVITFDYRGYAESNCYPSERGMMEDSRLVWTWVKQHAPHSKVYIWGHSLGSAAATYLTEELTHSQTEPDGLILDAPFTSIIDAASNHPLGRPYWPIMPLFRYLVFETFSERFESVNRLKSITCPLLILHGHNDIIIPFDLGRRMYEVAVESRKDNKESEPVEFVDCGNTTHKNNFASPMTQTALDRFISSGH